MKIIKYSLLFPLIMLLAACGSKSSTGNMDNAHATNPNIAFSEYSYDFGKIKQGEKVEHVFHFTNKGDQPLLIINARSTCGCTVPSYPVKPIKPGESGEITVNFNSAGKMGHITKPIFIRMNTTPPETILKINCDIVEPDK